LSEHQQQRRLRPPERRRVDACRHTEEGRRTTRLQSVSQIAPKLCRGQLACKQASTASSLQLTSQSECDADPRARHGRRGEGPRGRQRPGRARRGRGRPGPRKRRRRRGQRAWHRRQRRRGRGRTASGCHGAEWRAPSPARLAAAEAGFSELVNANRALHPGDELAHGHKVNVGPQKRIFCKL
jgi:hypothetical protein